MKILSLRFKNLNSLLGSWFIDFTSHSYITDGIFVITGPTGAGKTTILDGICLALYGRTPRLNKITKSENEIMSRKTGECFAEVAFETKKGRFKCHWSQHRANKKANGFLQGAKHELSYLDSEGIIASSIKDVAIEVELKTGMNFDRFTRSMLLAQGGFAAFLKAKAEDRAPVLEQITGTEIYSEISRLVHLRYKEEKEVYDNLNNMYKGIEILNEEEENIYIKILKEKIELEQKLIDKNTKLSKKVDWLNEIEELNKEIELLDFKIEDFIKKKEQLKPDLVKLEKAEKASDLEGEYIKLVKLKKDLNESSKSLNENQNKFQDVQLKVQEIKIKFQKAESNLNSIKDIQKIELKIISSVNELDSKINEKENTKNKVNDEISSLKAKYKEIALCKLNNEKKLENTGNELILVEQYLISDKTDSNLVSDLSAIEYKFEVLKSSYNKKVEYVEKLIKAKDKSKIADENIIKLEEITKNLKSELANLENQNIQFLNLLKEHLRGKELSQWYNELNINREKNNYFEKSLEVVKKIIKFKSELKDFELEENKYINIKKELSKKALKQSKLFEEKEKEADIIHRILRQRERERDFIEEREHLLTGKPCPLCGSEKHPYAENKLPVYDEIQAEFNKVVKLKKEISDKIANTNYELAEAVSSVKNSEKQIENTFFILQELEQESKELSKNIKSLDVSAKADLNVLKQLEKKLQAEHNQIVKKNKSDSLLIKEIEKLNEMHLVVQNDLKKNEKKYEEAKKTFQLAENTKVIAHNDLMHIEEEVEALKIEFKNCKHDALESIKLYGFKSIDESRIREIINKLQKRKQKWIDNQTKKERLERQILSVKKDLQSDKKEKTRLFDEKKFKEDEYDKILEKMKLLYKKRIKIYGNKVVKEEEKKIEEQVENAEDYLNKTRETEKQFNEDLRIIEDRIIINKGTVEKLKPELETSEKRFKSELIKSGFIDETDFNLSCLLKNERKELKSKIEIFIKEETELKALKNTLKEKLVNKKAEDFTKKTKEELLTFRDEITQEIKDIQQNIWEINLKLNNNKATKEKIKEQLVEIKKQEKELKKWDALNKLIGHHDGKTFRNFAQGLTFERVISNANKQLKKMTDRYLLLKDTKEPLDINVVDNYQAGEIRSTKNLSGGESFIVSLALALGLSAMTSKKVSVDSLFLDEGFGTLDEDSLQTAIEALSGLNQEGKLIGIISHVEALKDRINTQILIKPKSGGKSKISGPGCKPI